MYLMGLVKVLAHLTMLQIVIMFVSLVRRTAKLVATLGLKTALHALLTTTIIRMDLAKTHVPATIYQIVVMFVSHAIQIEELAVTLGNLTVLRARKISS